MSWVQGDMLQECRVYLNECLSSDLFMSWLAEPAENKEIILEVCTGYLTSYNAQDEVMMESTNAEARPRIRNLRDSGLGQRHPSPHTRPGVAASLPASR